ncbi:MAG: HDOD domain-containing protein [Planctomycetes bacterium]|nr:HDOD domain-containing protein [Planctomycetota bacterium]
MPNILPILRVVRSMRPLPAVAQQVLTLVQDPDYAIDELVDLVRTDPTLVARILRLCNSARSGLDQEISAIGDAVTYVGTRNLVQLTLVSCSASTFAATGTGRYTDADALWRHSLACALACQELAQQTGLVAPATAFTAGILHDVGRVALSQLPEASLEPPTEELPHERVERAVFGQDHAAVAGLVGDTWQLPRALVTALRTHHDPDALPGEPLPALLHVADQLALQQGFAMPFGRATASIAPAALARLGLSPTSIEAIAARAAAEMERTAELLNLGARPCR